MTGSPPDRVHPASPPTPDRTPRWPENPAPALLALAALALLPACGWNPYPGGSRPGSPDDPTPASAAQALSPRALAISPLSRIHRAESAPDQLVVHLTLQDGFGQPTKALGTVVIELDPPRGPGGLEGQTAPAAPAPRWEVDLRDPQTNAAAFDGLVTRTYVLRLTGLPNLPADAQPSASPRTARIHAAFTVIDAGWGDSRVLTAEAPVAW
jgi:hypothetical protein